MSIAAELHCHTVHSDGTFQPAELAESARANGLDLIALTDHNTMSGYADLAETGLPFIRGIEWTTFYGHMLVLGQKRFVDWRDASPDTIDAKIAEVHRAGGLAGIAHPFQQGSPMCTGCYWDFRVKDWSQADYMEVWHGSEFPPLSRHNVRAKRMWLELLNRGFHIAPVHGRDWHRDAYSPDPQACTYLDTDIADEEHALEAIARGRTQISLGPELSWRLEGDAGVSVPGDTVTAGAYDLIASVDMERRKEVWQRYDIRPDRFVVYGTGETVLATLPADGGDARVWLHGGYCRAELLGTARGKECAIALTAPIYCEAPTAL